MSAYQNCDGLKRRDFLKVGTLGGIGLTLADYLRMAEGAKPTSKKKSAIFVSLGGGPSHMDTFDLKPKAAAEFRGEFNPIPTKVPGVEICELLPRLAMLADKFAILRGVTHTLAAHEFGTQYLNTGNPPIPSLEFPALGAVVTKELPTDPDLPPWVAVPTAPIGPGYLGVAYGPMGTGSVPQAGRPFMVRGIALGEGLTVTDVRKRQRLLDDLDTAFDGYEKQNDLVRGLDQFSEQAYNIISSKRAREAFDVSKEPTQVSDLFGKHAFGQSCLLATRLVEAGVRFVTVNFGGWDTHADNFSKLRSNLLPQLDEGLSALFFCLEKRGLLDSTSVIVTGEFGRTPKINPTAGRDHWPRAMCVLMGGGGIKGGQVIGASNENGMEPAEKGFSPDDVAASFYHSLGIDHHKEYRTSSGRPMMIVRYGNPIEPLFG